MSLILTSALSLQDFADTTAPALTPIFQTARGETLLLLIRNTATLLKCMPRSYVSSMLVPLFARAADQGQPSVQAVHFCDLAAAPSRANLCCCKCKHQDTNRDNMAALLQHILDQLQSTEVPCNHSCNCCCMLWLLTGVPS